MDNRTFDDFDKYASNYRDIHSQNIQLSGADSFYFAEKRVKMLKAYEHNHSYEVLDLGCGDGVSEIFMQRYFDNWRIKGIDVSKESITMAKKLALTNASFDEYDGTHIPFDDSSFDIVFVAGVLHHISFDLHLAMLDEIKRVLKKGGRLVIFEHNPINPFTKYLVKTCVFDQNARLLRSAYLMTLLKELNLEIKQRIYFIFIPPWGLLKKLVYFERLLYWLPIGGKYMIRATKDV